MVNTDIETYQVVEELNNYLYDKYGEEEHQFQFSSNGYWNSILFNGYMIWSSEIDLRKFNDDTKDYEPLLTHIKKKFNNYIKELSKLKL